MAYVTTAMLTVPEENEDISVDSWAKARAVIERLSRKSFGRLLLYGEAKRQPGVMLLEFNAADGETPWCCSVSRPQWTHVLLDPDVVRRKRIRVTVEALKLPERLVMKAAKEFYETGKRKRSLFWGQSEKPLLAVLDEALGLADRW